MEAQTPNLLPSAPHKFRKSTWVVLGVIAGVIGMTSSIRAARESLASSLDRFLGVEMFLLLALPLLAVMLTIPKKTRSFGLGLLLACGVCFLVQLTICGGIAAFG
jgi:predicted membrane channel-forming protein YqfA (hemolysin III family)